MAPSIGTFSTVVGLLAICTQSAIMTIIIRILNMKLETSLLAESLIDWLLLRHPKAWINIWTNSRYVLHTGREMVLWQKLTQQHRIGGAAFQHKWYDMIYKNQSSIVAKLFSKKRDSIVFQRARSRWIIQNLCCRDKRMPWSFSHAYTECLEPAN